MPADRAPSAAAAARSRSTAAVLAACVLWGTTGTVAHFAPAGSSPALIGLATFGFGGLVLVALDARRVLALMRDRSAWPLLAAGALGVAAYAGFYYWSMSLIGVAIGNAIALGSGPVFAALLELVIERRRVRLGWAIATGISVAGIALLSASALAETGTVAGPAAASTPGAPILGVALGLGAGFGYALYSWAGASLIARGHPSRAAMAGVFGVASIALAPAFALAGPGPLLQPAGLAILAYLALIPMALSYLLFGYGLRVLRASTATTLALVEPVVATVLAILVLHERLAVLGWLGIALILVGIITIAIAERRSGTSPPTPGA